MAAAGCTELAVAQVTPIIITVASDCPINLFKDAKKEFDVQFPMIQFATEGEVTTVDMPVLNNSTYTGIVSLTSNLGSASAFTQVDTANG